MPLSLRASRLYARQLALPAIGVAGQERLGAATVAVFGEAPDALESETAALYLRAAGVGTVVTPQSPPDRAGWRRALDGVDLALRFALDDDALLDAAIEAGRSLVLGRVREQTVELLALREQRACRHPNLPETALPAQVHAEVRLAARDALAGAGAVVLGTLAASEALLMLVDPRRRPAARLLRLPLAGGDPIAADLPWPTPCPHCAPARPRALD